MREEYRRKLSDAQQRVINLLNENEGSYILNTTYWDFQRVITPNNKKCIPDTNVPIPNYFSKDTFNALLKMKLIEKFDDSKYKLK